MKSRFLHIAMEIERSIGLVDESRRVANECRRLTNESRRLTNEELPAVSFTPTDLVQPLRCDRWGGEAPLVRRSPDRLAPDYTEIWTFQCIRCDLEIEQAGKR